MSFGLPFGSGRHALVTAPKKACVAYLYMETSFARKIERGGNRYGHFPDLCRSGISIRRSPDLSRLGTREPLSQSAIDGFFAIMDKWQISIERAGELLGGMPRSTWAIGLVPKPEN